MCKMDMPENSILLESLGILLNSMRDLIFFLGECNGLDTVSMRLWYRIWCFPYLLHCIFLCVSTQREPLHFWREQSTPWRRRGWMEASCLYVCLSLILLWCYFSKDLFFDSTKSFCFPISNVTRREKLSLGAKARAIFVATTFRRSQYLSRGHFFMNTVDQENEMVGK
jgi:hypothetical protein